MEIRTEDMSYSFGDNKVLSNINFVAEAGMVTGIIGPNGSGKSTLLRIMGNILKPNMGKVYLDDRDIAGFSTKEFAKAVATVGQQDMVYFPYTVWEIVSMGRAPYLKYISNETKEDKMIIEEALNTTGVASLMDRSIMELSSGERQRVFIARALAQTPKILMLDEPTSHLDINFQLEICTLAKNLAKKGMTVVLVLHDLNLAARFCDQVAILSKGEIIAKGAAWDVIKPDIIKNVYSVDAIVEASPVGDYPTIHTIG